MNCATSISGAVATISYSSPELAASIGKTPSSRGMRARSTSMQTPLAAATWPMSAISPSEMSIADVAQRGDRKRKDLSGSKIATDDRAQYCRRAFADSRRNGPGFVAIALWKRESNHDPEWAGSHRRQVAERCRRRAISDLEVVEPVAAKVNALDGSVGADDELLSFGDLEDRGVIPDALGCLAPFRQQGADDVEFPAGSKRDVV